MSLLRLQFLFFIQINDSSVVDVNKKAIGKFPSLLNFFTQIGFVTDENYLALRERSFFDEIDPSWAILESLGVGYVEHYNGANWISEVLNSSYVLMI